MSKPQTILLIEDNALLAMVSSEVLRAHGFSVHVANGGVQAFHVLGVLTPDIILIDYDMPDMNGAQVVKQVRGRGYTGPVIMWSGQPDLPPDAMMVTVFVCKGAGPAALLNVINDSIIPFNRETVETQAVLLAGQDSRELL